MEDYTFRKATAGDIPFLAEVIIAAEKGSSTILGFSTLFNLPEERIKELIISMLEEEIDGCEFSLSSFYLATFNGVPVAGTSSWIEAHENPPSKLLKSNLLSYTFPRESFDFFRDKAPLLQGMTLERDPETLQFEYGFTSAEHRGKGLITFLLTEIMEQTKKNFPGIKKAQVQCFANNIPSVKQLSKLGFEVTRSVKSDDPGILKFLPFNEKLFLEKNI